MIIDENTLVRVYSFDLQFTGGKRTIFYRRLFGFRSKSSHEDRHGREKVYESFYPGVLTPLPHLKLGKSVIAIPKSAMQMLDVFFADEQWGSIELYSFDGILPSEDRLDAMEEAMGRIRTSADNTLSSEIDFLRSIADRQRIDCEEKNRVLEVVRKSEDLMEHDWSDNYKFSNMLEQKLNEFRNMLG